MTRGARGATTAGKGSRAEAAALTFLTRQGLRPVARNFRCRGGELDLVMLDGTELVVVEVRYRARGLAIDPASTVTAAKRRRVLHAAAWFLQARPAFADHAMRFDVLAVTGALERPHCDWIRGAFDATGG